MVLVPPTSSWKIYLSPTIFTCPGQEDNMFFRNLHLAFLTRLGKLSSLNVLKLDVYFTPLLMYC